MKIFGHRGAAGYKPENTLPSIRHALEMGVSGIEFDVRCTQDKCPVLMHDDSVDRTTSGTGVVAEMTFDELQQVETGDHRIPSLQETLREIGDQTDINIELKDFASARAVVEVLGSFISERIVSQDRILISSLDWLALQQTHKLAPQFSIGVLRKGEVDEAEFWKLTRKVEAVSANIDLPNVSAKFVEKAHRRNLEVMVFTVNTPEDAAAMKDLGVDAIFSDYPDRVVPLAT